MGVQFTTMARPTGVRRAMFKLLRTAMWQSLRAHREHNLEKGSRGASRFRSDFGPIQPDSGPTRPGPI